VTAARAGSPEPGPSAGLAAAAPRALRQEPLDAPPQPVGGHRAPGPARCPGRRRTPIRRRQGRTPPARPSASFELCELLSQTFSCLPSVAAQCRQREPSPPASIVPRSSQNRNPTWPGGETACLRRLASPFGYDAVPLGKTTGRREAFPGATQTNSPPADAGGLGSIRSASLRARRRRRPRRG